MHLSYRVGNNRSLRRPFYWVRKGCEMDKTEEELKQMKEELLQLHQKTVRAAYEYFAALPLGRDRVIAGELYESLRNATRI